MRFPFSREEIQRRIAMTPPGPLFNCWVCRVAKGRHLYAWPLTTGEYTIRIACDNCVRKLKRMSIVFYN